MAKRLTSVDLDHFNEAFWEITPAEVDLLVHYRQLPPDARKIVRALIAAFPHKQ